MGFRIDNEVNEARVRELARFLKVAFDGNSAALGRRLGYKDGSFVGQMLRREKAITEVTYAKLCGLHEVKLLINKDTPVFGIPHLSPNTSVADAMAFAAPEAAYEPRFGSQAKKEDSHHASLAHAVSHRQSIVTPKTIVWEDLVKETIEGQFLLAVRGDALMPTYPPGQMAIWQACDDKAASPGQAVLIKLPGDQFELRFLERRGGTWAGVSQRIGFGELQPERDQAVVVARLRYLDLG